MFERIYEFQMVDPSPVRLLAVSSSLVEIRTQKRWIHRAIIG